MSVMRTKSVERSIADTEEPEFRLKKSLSALDLTIFGVGVVIGAGMSGILAGIRLGHAGIPYTIVEKNPGYYTTPPHVDAIGVTVYQNADAMLAALKGGQLDSADTVPPTLAKQWSTDPNYTLQVGEKATLPATITALGEAGRQGAGGRDADELAENSASTHFPRVPRAGHP